MLRFFRNLFFGHARRHRLEAVLCVLGVALGVAVVVGIDAAVAACVRSFGGAVQSLAERSTHSIFAAEGRLTDEQFTGLVRRRLPYPLAPVIDRRVLISAEGGTAASAFLEGRLVGLDVFSERSLRSFTRLQSTLDEDSLHAFLTRPNTVVLVDALADRVGVKAGAAVRLTVGGRRVAATVVGVVRPEGAARSQLSDVLVADIATAQELTEAVGTIDRIDTRLENDAEVAALTTALPPGLVLRSTRQQAAATADLVSAYRMNLNALSLMASFVAVFIVYNSMLVSVRQRATTLGILRCLGASRAQLGGIYLSEAIGVAVVGGGLGLLAGWGLSAALVGYVATTINDLYAAVRPGPVALDAAAAAKGMAVSVVSCVVGAAVPLYQASRTPPVNAFRVTEGHRAAASAASGWLLATGGAMLALAYAAYAVPGESPAAGFVMALLIATGFALVCPFATRLACAALAATARPLQALPLQMSAAGVSRSLGITGVAVAATMLAMSMNVGVRTMVSSFRGALGDWFDQRFDADVFVAPDLLVNHKVDATLDPAAEAWIRGQAEVAGVVTVRSTDLKYDGRPIMLVATDVGHVIRHLPIKIGPRTGFDPRRDVLVSEPLAGRAKLRVGDTIRIDTPGGPRPFRVHAVYFDFGSERGQVMLDRATYAPAWRDDSVSALHVRLAPGADPAAAAARWAAAMREMDQPVAFNTFGGVRAEVLKVFDRTFAVTNVLTWLAGGVAFCGMAGALLALSLARRRDYSLLAAIGMSGRQTAVWIVSQGLLIAVTAAVVAAVAGTALAYVLAYVIQYRSFGWSIPATAQPRYWVENLLLGCAAALVAAAYPVRRLRAVPPADGLRQE